VKTYTVTAVITISLHGEVEADSPEEAERLAECLELPTMCNQCAGGSGDGWRTSGEYDGVPTSIEVEESDDE